MLPLSSFRTNRHHAEHHFHFFFSSVQTITYRWMCMKRYCLAFILQIKMIKSQPVHIRHTSTKFKYFSYGAQSIHRIWDTSEMDIEFVTVFRLTILLLLATTDRSADWLHYSRRRKKRLSQIVPGQKLNNFMF